MKMIRKVPTVSTIRKNIHWYAEKVGFTIHRLANGNYNVYDTKMKYIVHHSVNMDTVVRVVTDEVYAIAHRKEICQNGSR